MKKINMALFLSIGLVNANASFAVESPVVGTWKCTGSNGTLTVKADGSGSFAYVSGSVPAACAGTIFGVNYKAACPDWPLGYDGETGRSIDARVDSLGQLTGSTKALNGTGSWSLSCIKKR